MYRRSLAAPFGGLATLALVLAACQGGTAGETATPTLDVASPSPSVDISPDMSPDESPDESPDASPTESPDATPGDSETFELDTGLPGLTGELTLTEVGTSTELVLDFDNVDLPDNVGAARVLVGACEGATQSVADLEVTDGQIEGTVPIALEPLLALPHGLAFYADEDSDEPVACVNLPTQPRNGDTDASPSPTSS
jgi:hypothetical protein